MAYARYHVWLIAALLLAACATPTPIPERLWRCYAIDTRTGAADTSLYCVCSNEAMTCIREGGG